MPEDNNDLFGVHLLSRFERIEDAVSDISKAMQSLAKNEGTVVAMAQRQIEQMEAFTTLAKEMRDGFVRTHERIDRHQISITGMDVFIQSASERLKVVDDIKFSSAEAERISKQNQVAIQDICKQIEPLIGLKNKITGAVVVLTLVAGVFTWFINREISRLDKAIEVAQQQQIQFALQIDRLEQREKGENHGQPKN